MRFRPILRAFFCSSKPSQKIPKVEPKLIEVKVKYQGDIYNYKFPLFSKLAPNLQKARVPLEFECGYSCSCGTCPVQIQDSQQFQRLKKDQPYSQSQLAVIKQNGYDQQKTRLSCQLFVMEYFKDITFVVQ